MSEQKQVLSDALIAAFASEWSKDVGFYEFERNDFYGMVRAIEKEVLARQSPAPIPEQVAQASGIEGVTRYAEHWSGVGMAVDKTGEYVLLSQVERLFATQSAQEVTQQAAKAETTEQANVLPPTRGTESQHEATARDAAQWRDLLAAVMAEMSSKFTRGDGNAPGHGHDKPGIWDGDNGVLAGKECAWCKVWNAARSALADEAELASRFRAQGGNTNAERSDLAPTTSTVSASGADGSAA